MDKAAGGEVENPDSELARKKAEADRLRAAEKFMVVGTGEATCKVGLAGRASHGTGCRVGAAALLPSLQLKNAERRAPNTSPDVCCHQSAPAFDDGDACILTANGCTV